MNTIKQKYKLIPMVVFLVLVFGITILNFCKADVGFSQSENRYLAKAPTFSWEGLFSGKFTKDVETYITDQFIWRDEFIGVKTQTDFLSGKKDTNGVYFAKNDYLIEKHDKANIDFERLARNKDKLYSFVSQSAKKLGNDHVAVMIVPTASNVLSDMLPPFAADFDQNGMIDDIKANLKNGTFVDVRAALKQHQSENIYYKTDHHWTSNGAFIAYREWCDSMGIVGNFITDFEVKPVTDEFFGTVYTKARLFSSKADSILQYTPKFSATYSVDYNNGEKVTSTLYDADYLEKRDKYAYFLSGNNPMVKITSNSKNKKKLLLVKDSFAHSFVPFAVNDFSEVHMMDLRYLNISLQKYMDENSITDVLFLFNTINFAKEKTLYSLDK